MTDQTPAFVRVEVRRDGVVRETFATGCTTNDLNAAFEYILRNQGQSVSHATRYEGWDIVGVDADNNLYCGVCGNPHPKTERHGNRY